MGEDSRRPGRLARAPAPERYGHSGVKEGVTDVTSGLMTQRSQLQILPPVQIRCRRTSAQPGPTVEGPGFLRLGLALSSLEIGPRLGVSTSVPGTVRTTVDSARVPGRGDQRT